LPHPSWFRYCADNRLRDGSDRAGSRIVRGRGSCGVADRAGSRLHFPFHEECRATVEAVVF